METSRVRDKEGEGYQIRKCWWPDVTRWWRDRKDEREQRKYRQLGMRVMEPGGDRMNVDHSTFTVVGYQESFGSNKVSPDPIPCPKKCLLKDPAPYS